MTINWRRYVLLIGLLPLWFGAPAARAAAGETNYVLQLGGTNGCLQIAGGKLGDLEEATIEGWVRFREATTWARFFDLGQAWESLNVGRLHGTPHLNLETTFGGRHQALPVVNAFRTNEWMHVAAVMSKRTQRVYLNGMLNAEATNNLAFNEITRGQRFWIGRNNWFDVMLDLPDSAIDVDEFRIWNGVRSGDEIRGGMFRPVDASEQGLVFLLNFDGGELIDQGPRKIEVSAIGEARAVAAPLPKDEAGLPAMAVISARVVNKNGDGIADAKVLATTGEIKIELGITGQNGEFEFGTLAAGQTELLARKDKLSGKSRAITVAAGARIQETIVLLPPETISGSVSAYDKSPIAGMAVQLLAIGATNAVSASTATDERGNFSFEGLEPGEYRVQIIGRNGPIVARGGETLRMSGGMKVEDVNFVTAPLSRGAWQTFNVAGGLPSDVEIRRILFEPNGVVWFATQGGAARYDGAEWQVFTTEEGLPDDYIFNLARDTQGNIWIGTQTGIARYDGKKIRSWEINATSGVDAVLADDDGTVWFGGAGASGSFLVHVENEVLKYIRREDGLPGRVFKMAKGKGRDIWLTGPLGFGKFDGTTFTTVGDFAQTGTDTPSVAPDGSIWFGGQENGFSGVWKYDGSKLQFFSLVGKLLNNAGINATYWSRDGTFWAAGRGGLVRYDGREFVAVVGEDGLPVRGIISIAESPDGAMWFGTFGRGALRYEPRPALEKFTIAHGLAANDTVFIRRASDGTLWFHPPPSVGNNDGSLWDGEKFVPLSDVTGVRGWKGLGAETAKGLVIPTRGGVLVKSGEGIKALGPPGDGPAGLCYSAVEAKDGSIWVGSSSGVARLENDKWTVHRPNTGFPLGWAITLLADKTGRVWAGNYAPEGLAVFENESWTHYSVTNGLAGRRIHDLIEDKDGSIWIATEAGLSRFQDGRFTNFTKAKDGLPHRTAHSLCRDSRGILWVGTSAGVARWDGRVWSTLRAADGISGDGVRAIAEGSDGAMWFGTDEGVTRYQFTKQHAVAPAITVLLDKAYASVEKLPKVLRGRRVQFRAEVGDVKTRPETRRFVWGVFSGNFLGDNSGNWPGWLPASSNPMMEWVAPAAGKYTAAVRYVDRDMNYSEPALAQFEVVPAWYMNAFITIPVGGVSFGLLGWAFVARWLYMQKRREAERLRGEMLAQEQKARAALEHKNKELEKAMEAAESANRTKSQFLATMSHELRTPLNAILGYSEMLEEEMRERESEDLVPDLQKIHGAGKHLLGLINDILDLSKIEAGKMTIFCEHFEVAKTVEDIAHTVEPLVTRNGNKLCITIEPGIGSMYSDLTKVRQTLFNLLSNAAKFTDKGRVSLDVTEISGSDMLQFTVTDTGIGMTSEQVGKIFQAFMQADASTSRKYGGTGLGLALSQNFCRMLGGDIEVKSEVGKGSTFTVRLPRKIQAPASDKVAAPSVASQNGRAHVLVIDDDPAVRELMNRHLTKEGYAVSLAATGEQGLALARQRKPDIITVDIIMPGQDGWSVLNTIKADVSLQDIPVVMVSMVDEKQLGFSLGAADYIVKPINWDRLSSVLQKLRPELPSNEILVVEDDPAMREMLQRQLEKQTWSVRAAENGRVALEVLTNHTPGIVLLDLMMPEMDGFAFLAEFRRKPEWQKIPVIVVTAKDLSAEDLSQLDGRIRKVVQKSAHTVEEVIAEIRAASGPSKA